MAIQNRRGVYADFNPALMLPGEYAVVLSGDPEGTDGYAVYMCYASGIVKRLISDDDLDAILAVLSWNDIIDKPSTFPSTWASIANKPSINPGTGTNSTKENTASTASGSASHAEGASTTASGNRSHAEGYYTTASGVSSHAEGHYTTASGIASHAENSNCKAFGDSSHAEGNATIANRFAQHVFGTYNTAEPTTTDFSVKGTYVEIVGNGTGTNNRSNARTLDWSGNEVLAGKLTVGAAPTADMDVAPKKYVDDLGDIKQNKITISGTGLVIN